MDPNSSLIAEILKIPEAQSAIQAALDQETTALFSEMRMAAIVGDKIRAALIEGKLQALDEVIGILTRFADKAKAFQE